MINQINDQQSNQEYFLLRKQFMDGVSKRLSRLRQLNAELAILNTDELYSTLQSFHYELHKLTGAAGSYEVLIIENHSRELENLVWISINQEEVDCNGRSLYDLFLPKLMLIEHAYLELIKKGNL